MHLLNYDVSIIRKVVESMVFHNNGVIGDKIVKNRIVALPVCIRAYTKKDGLVTKEQLERYRILNSNNIGVIIVESCAVEERCQRIQTNIGIWSDEQIEGLNKLADVCSANETIAIIQLNYRDLTCLNNNYSISEIDEELAKNIQKQFLSAAVRAKKAGFDGIELHCAHGYFLNQILSIKNKRLWEYGPEKEKKVQYICEIIQMIKFECGNKFLIGIRYGCNEPDIETSIFYAKCFENAGADYLSISNGIGQDTFESCLRSNIDLGVGEPTLSEMNSKIYAAGIIKKEVAIPIIASGNIFNKKIAEKILHDGIADFVGIARGFLADPFWGRKVLNEKPVNLCCGCYDCKWFVNQEQCPAKRKL